MARALPLRSVITGGPGAGKSTLLAAAEAAGLCVSPEVAREILRQPGGMSLRDRDPAGFAQAMLDREVRSFKDSVFLDRPVLFDRGFPDIVGFLDLSGLPLPGELDRICHELRYEGPIFHAPPWEEIYAGDAERIQDWGEAVASDAAVTAAWHRYGYCLTDLPLAPVSERLTVVQREIAARQAAMDKRPAL